MNNKITREQLHETLEKYKNTASQMINDSDRMEAFFLRLEKKLKKVPVAGTILADIATLLSLVRSYVKKEYNVVPMGSILAALAALVYFVVPIDLIPDFVMGVGFADDAALLALVMKLIHDDLKEYREWQITMGYRPVHDADESEEAEEIDDDSL